MHRFDPSAVDSTISIALLQVFRSSLQSTYSAKSRHRTCVKCPGLITAIAREGLDGILMNPPAPLACKTSLPFADNLYKVETLFGPDLPFVLPQGNHQMIGKIRNVETGLVVRSCLLKYNVIVSRCRGLPHIKNKNLRMSCTAGAIWGSKCAFECRNKAKHLSHREPLVCSEGLQWVGEEPECISDNGENISVH